MEPTTNCKNISSLLDAYHDGEINQQQKDAVARHLMNCADCTARLAELGKVVHTLNTMPQKAVSAKFAGQLDTLVDKLAAGDVARVAAGQPAAVSPSLPSGLTGSNIRWLAPLAAAAAVIVVAIGVRTFTGSNQPPVTAQTPKAPEQLIAGNSQHNNVMPPAVQAGQQDPNALPSPAQGTKGGHGKHHRKRLESDAQQQEFPPQPEVAQNDMTPPVVAPGAGTHLARLILQPGIEGGDVHRSSQAQKSAVASSRQPGSGEEVAELPSGTSSFSDAVGLATDEDGLYDIKM